MELINWIEVRDDDRSRFWFDLGIKLASSKPYPINSIQQHSNGNENIFFPTHI